MNQVIIDFGDSSDEGIVTEANAAIAGCNISNTNFSLVTQLTAVVSALAAYNPAFGVNASRDLLILILHPTLRYSLLFKA